MKNKAFLKKEQTTPLPRKREKFLLGEYFDTQFNDISVSYTLYLIEKRRSNIGGKKLQEENKAVFNDVENEMFLRVRY